ncbi:uncharacterized protein LOC131857381 [Cryptomeria japonica]|uniref:uncharacterized protein LOC131857381 n=1 Tax=Cryptomeria japonica TaxID=3369 RepID=UPI0027DA2F76|nr:uncharacterized protein LOC131857381 [Cryptomeria japonica]
MSLFSVKLSGKSSLSRVSNISELEKGRFYIEVPDLVIEHNINLMALTLVGNILGPRPIIDVVKAFAKHKWVLKGQVEITTMSKGVLSMSFSCVEDMSRVLCDGAWLIGKSMLALQKWLPKMDLNESFFVQTPIWVKLHSLPLEFWVEYVFKGITSSFGELLSMDPIIAARRRLAFERICVGAMKGTDMPLSIAINSKLGKWVQPMEYESVPFTCFHCKKSEHTAKKCPLQVVKEKKKKYKTMQWRAKNPAKQLVIAEGKEMVEEAKSVIILNTFEKQGNNNLENLKNHRFEGGKEDQIGKDERERQNAILDEKRSDNLEDEEIQVVL